MSSVRFSHRVENWISRSVLSVLMAMPYKRRVRTMGWIFTHLLAPVAGWRRRIRDNLALARPDLGSEEVERIVRAVPVNIGRTLIEIYSGKEFVDQVKDTPLTGPGAAALDELHKDGIPLVLLTGHLGNYDVLRAMLYARGYPLGALYKPMSNPAFNEHYLTAIAAIGEPLFPTNREGIGGLIRHLKDGKAVGIVADVASRKAPLLSFFDQPAHTPLSAAEWSVKYGAHMIPIFGLRNPDGFTFTIHVCEEIPPGDPEEMMQTYNNVLEAIVRENMDQWYWSHRRWKRSGN